MIFLFSQFGAAIAFVVGLVACFAGYRLFRLVLALAGFVIGAALAGGLFFTFVQPSDVAALIVGIIGGVVGAFLLGFFYFVGIFVAGAGFGSLVGLVVAANFGWQRTLVVILAAVLCGFLALALQKVLIVVSTAFLGSWATLAAAASFTGVVVPGQLLSQPPVYWTSPWATFFLVAWLLLAGLGIAAQYKTAPAPDSRARERTLREERASR